MITRLLREAVGARLRIEKGMTVVGSISNAEEGHSSGSFRNFILFTQVARMHCRDGCGGGFFRTIIVTDVVAVET